MKINRSFSRITTIFVLLFTSLIYKGQTQSEIFTYTGGTQTFTVPTGVTSVEIKAWGAGGGGSLGSGGSGGFVKATLPVNPGANLNIVVGGGGTYSASLHNGGYGGGGNAGRKGGSGGGYSAVFTGATLAATNVRVLAGGGGGGGFATANTYGGPGGAGDAGDRDAARTGGKKGTPSVGGVPGLISSNSNGATAGTQLQGGTGSREYGIFNRDYDSGGGGGGGGFYGGGGGYGSNEPFLFGTDYKSSGGGGGSNIIRPSTTLQIENSVGNFTTNGTSPIAPYTTESGYISGVGRGGAENSAGGNGLVIITYTRPSCSGIPTGGTTTVNPNTGPASSAFAAAVTGSSSGLGLSYQWQISAVGGTNVNNWTDIPGQTGETANLIAENLPPGSVMYYRRAITCDLTGDKRFSAQAKFTISSPSYCTPSSTTANSYYITNVEFLGTLNDTDNPSAFSSNPRGYQDFTTLASRAVQEQGGGINVSVKNTLESVTMAWVDWNQDGTFQSGEQVYTTGTTSVGYTVFGFTVPSTQAPGYYRIRIRIANTSGFGPCGNIANGEAEDYLFQVIQSCSSAITGFTATQECGVGKKVVFNFTTVNANKVRIYKSETDTVPFAEINSNGTASFTTPILNETTVYYATALTTGASGCESKKRIKITAKVNPIPEITFDNAVTSFCGDSSGDQSLTFSAGGDKETVDLFNENFDSGLGVFTNFAAGEANSKAYWQRRQSVYVPGSDYTVLKPALASGLSGDGFALANTDIGSGTNRLNRLTTTASYNTQDYLNLHLDFNMYTFFEGIKTDVEFFSVEVSQNNGSSWETVKKYTTNIGIPNKWIQESLDLSAYKNSANLKLRFVISAFGAGSQWSGDIAGIDAVRLYGEKPLTTSFNWSVSNGDPIIFNSDCTTPYNGATPQVCIKPSADLLLSEKEWKVKATATLSNGCSASGTLTIINNNRTWDYPGRTQWTTYSSWQPAEVPTIDKCVVVKTPVIISGGTDAFAKNIKIENNGQLTINGSLTVNDIINNTGEARDLIVKSDGNLLQVDDGVVNTTPIAVRRLFTWSDNDRKEYNYISSPVYNQNMKEIFGDNTANVPFVTVLNEPTSMFVNAKPADYLVVAKGFSVKEAKSTFTGVSAEGIANNEAEYKGVPNNGNISLPLDWSAGNRGYNVAGNPYPSNIDIVELYQNSLIVNPTNALDTTIQFWDNVVNHTYTQLGGSYKGYSYALYNVESDEAIYAPGHDPNGPDIIGTKTPSRIVKTDQAFMVRALAAGATLEFNNAIRKTDRNTVFFGKNSQRDAYHLEMITAEGLGVQNAIVYMPTGSANYGREDSKLPSSTMSDALFSFAGETKIVINGRSLFTTDDVINLGTRHFVPGMYIIRANDLKGVFANGQPIYLKDKILNILTDISVAEYVFTSDSGEFTNRFEIVYKPEIVLATDGTVVKANIQVYRDAQEFVVESSAKKITSYELYDMSGRIITSQKANAKEVRFNAEQLVDGAYVLKAQLEDGEIFTKKLRK